MVARGNSDRRRERGEGGVTDDQDRQITALTQENKAIKRQLVDLELKIEKHKIRLKDIYPPMR